MSNKHQLRNILVYADWQGLNVPILMGYLRASDSRAKEVFAFEYDDGWLKGGLSQMIDPDIQYYTGIQYPTADRPNFGMFLDSSPDRWGRVLMQRREAMEARQADRKPLPLMESDFLLGVYDSNRIGALRFKLDAEGPFLNDNREMATPPWALLRELEEASLKLEENNLKDSEYRKWLNLLIAPGSSLGGARPKASVTDANGHLWIAKFPSNADVKDVGAWEMVANDLAKKCKINISAAKIQRFNNKHRTFLTKRFDRTISGERIHFASAMNLLGFVDGQEGASYLHLAEFLLRHGANIDADLQELWRRIVFNIIIKNTDDHLRNHGFLLSDRGWLLSPAYDINPIEYGTGLSLNISETDNSLNLELAMEVASFFRISKKDAEKIINAMTTETCKWREIAGKYHISKSEQDSMERAFIL